jgi:hypothetical protein
MLSGVRGRGAAVVVLTAPLLVVLTSRHDHGQRTSVIWIQLAIGAVGLLATGGSHRWAHRPERAVLARKLDDSNRWQHSQAGTIAAAEDIARFEARIMQSHVLPLPGLFPLNAPSVSSRT